MSELTREELEGVSVHVRINAGYGINETYTGTLVDRGPNGLAMVTTDQRAMFFPWGHVISVEVFEEKS